MKFCITSKYKAKSVTIITPHERAANKIVQIAPTGVHNRVYSFARANARLLPRSRVCLRPPVCLSIAVPFQFLMSSSTRALDNCGGWQAKPDFDRRERTKKCVCELRRSIIQVAKARKEAIICYELIIIHVWLPKRY